MTRKILKFTPEFDFNLIAIASTENIYRLAFIINNTTGLSFEADQALTIWHPKLTEPQKFTVFVCNEEESFITLRLISNKCENGLLIEELKNIDYLIHLTGEINETFLKSFFKKLKQSPEIQAVYNIEPNTLVSKQKLVF
ncbi:MAG TPA: IPExxxVDY family protein [Bacteroidales bacterium]|jgi:hypothetical protein|nr:IPExxxVDY family protein [Bacteroidales bacterium]